MVQHHGDIGAEGLLIFHGQLGGQEALRAIDVRPEQDSLVIEASQVAQAEHLEAAAVGEDGPVPRHERVQATHPLDRVDAGAQGQVVGVGQDDLGADAAQVVGPQGLDRGQGAHRYEGRGPHGAMGCR